MIYTDQITVKSPNPAPKLLDITKKVEKSIKSSKIQNGTVLVFARHTTAAIIIQEAEKKLIKDLKRLIGGIAPNDTHYHHNSSPDHLRDGLPNGHSHCQHLLLGSSEIIPLSDGKMLLGAYQKIFLVELDRTRMREIVIQVTGE